MDQGQTVNSPECIPVKLAIASDVIRMTWPGMPAGDREGITVLAAGDWASCRCYADAAERAPESLYDGLAADIRDADISVANFECSLSGKDPTAKEGPHLKGAVASARALKAAGFDIACLGNNHSADFGDDGLRESLALFREGGLPVTGAGLNVDDAFRPVILARQGVRVGLLSVADPEDQVASPHGGGIASAMDLHVLDHMRALKAECDVTVLFVHGGREYVPVPSLYWYDQVLELAEAGADVVIGHHPHVPQGGTVLKASDGRTVPILFSTGNFVFRPALPKANEIPPHTGDGYMVRVKIACGDPPAPGTARRDPSSPDKRLALPAARQGEPSGCAAKPPLPAHSRGNRTHSVRH
jgi:poly-gamma-glutamate synthesis protein (capsule biosynthesis protein)